MLYGLIIHTSGGCVFLFWPLALANVVVFCSDKSAQVCIILVGPSEVGIEFPVESNSTFFKKINAIREPHVCLRNLKVGKDNLLTGGSLIDPARRAGRQAGLRFGSSQLVFLSESPLRLLGPEMAFPAQLRTPTQHYRNGTQETQRKFSHGFWFVVGLLAILSWLTKSWLDLVLGLLQVAAIWNQTF